MKTIDSFSGGSDEMESAIEGVFSSSDQLEVIIKDILMRKLANGMFFESESAASRGSNAVTDLHSDNSVIENPTASAASVPSNVFVSAEEICDLADAESKEKQLAKVQVEVRYNE